MNYEDMSALCGSLAEEIGLGNITTEEANRILRGDTGTEEIYFGTPIDFSEFLRIHGDGGNVQTKLS